MDQESALGKWLELASWAGWGRAGKDKPDKKQQKAANGKWRPAGSATLRGEGAVGTMRWQGRWMSCGAVSR